MPRLGTNTSSHAALPAHPRLSSQPALDFCVVDSNCAKRKEYKEWTLFFLRKIICTRFLRPVVRLYTLCLGTYSTRVVILRQRGKRVHLNYNRHCSWISIYSIISHSLSPDCIANRFLYAVPATICNVSSSSPRISSGGNHGTSERTSGQPMEASLVIRGCLLLGHGGPSFLLTNLKQQGPFHLYHLLSGAEW